jgi:hypothetical protein
MMIRSITSVSLALATFLTMSVPSAHANAITRHTRILPGSCVETEGTASATYVGHNTLLLSTHNKTAFDSFAAATFTASQPGVGLVFIPLPQGTVSFTVSVPSKNQNNEYSVIGYYENNTYLLTEGFFKKKGDYNFNVNTVAPANAGQLLGVTFFWTAENESVNVSNFEINNLGLAVDLTNPQGCDSPFYDPPKPGKTW